MLQEFVDFLKDICRGYVETTTECDVTVRNSMNNLHFRIFLSKVEKTQLQLRHKKESSMSTEEDFSYIKGLNKIQSIVFY